MCYNQFCGSGSVLIRFLLISQICFMKRIRKRVAKNQPKSWKISTNQPKSKKYFTFKHTRCFLEPIELIVTGDNVGEPEVVWHRQLLHESRLSQGKIIHFSPYLTLTFYILKGIENIIIIINRNIFNRQISGRLL